MGCDHSSVDQGPQETNQGNGKKFQSREIPCEIFFDLHGVLSDDARAFVTDALKSYPKTVCGKRVMKINFITGQGHHSADQKPVLKPMVLDHCKSLGYNAEVNQYNQGIITVSL